MLSLPVARQICNGGGGGGGVGGMAGARLRAVGGGQLPAWRGATLVRFPPPRRRLWSAADRGGGGAARRSRPARPAHPGTRQLPQPGAARPSAGAERERKTGGTRGRIGRDRRPAGEQDRKSTRLNSSH